MLWRFFVAVAGVILAACGGKAMPAASLNNGGTGTLNLLVKADVDGVVSSSGSVTDLVVNIRDGAGNKGSGATVAILNQTWNSVAVAEVAAGSGDYRKQMTSFPSGDFGLSVACNPCSLSPSGTITGNIQGVVVGGPGGHAFNFPKTAGGVPRDRPRTCGWATPS